MHPLLTKRIEIPWTRVTKGAAILLSLLPWAFIAAVILFWHRIDDYTPQFLIAPVVCCFCSSFAVLLFIRLRDNSDTTRVGAFWIFLAALPILLIPFLGCWYVVYGLGYFVTHLGSMHDSM
ncbi:MAG: hypothetical protein ABSH15_10050 [Verrucomicrobiota bacterium]|jgi:hypothetical protein